MASVRLNGDTSGFIEISAPNVAGSTTITLPATSGGNFLVTDSNGDLNVDSGTLFVDASTNRVGVGTTSPDELLHIANTGGGASLLIETSTSAGGNLLFGDADSDTRGRVQYLHSDDSLNFWTAGTSKAIIDSSGRVLVGLTTGTNRNFLQIQGDVDNGATGVGGISLRRVTWSESRSIRLARRGPSRITPLCERSSPDFTRLVCATAISLFSTASAAGS